MNPLVTIERATIHLQAWLDAELAVSSGQSYSIGTRSLTRANLSEIRKQIIYWESQLVRLNGRGRRAKRFVPRDL